uniref:Choline-phosphate cytidylyltransferase 1 n=1 Tax=Rhizophora mucronata TaxID=61149 RepID=A0A2P2LF35_RHIMU
MASTISSTSATLALSNKPRNCFQIPIFLLDVVMMKQPTSSRAKLL